MSLMDRYRLAFEATEYFWWEVDLKTGVAIQPPEIYRALGIEDQKDRYRTVEQLHALVHPEDLAELKESVRRHLAGEEPFHFCEWRARTARGDWIWFQSKGKVMAHDASGEPHRVFGITKDITEERRLRDAMEKALETAEKANEEKSRFLAVMSHEIRTPLNTILGMSELLSATPLNGRQADYVASLQSSAKTLTGLVGDILDMSKIESGNMRLKTEPVAPSALLKDIGTLFEEAAKEKGILLSCHAVAGTPPRILGDGTRLRRVLMNLVGNALKFTERGEVQATVELLPEDSGAGRLLFKVRDTGIGISDALQGRVLERFVQASDSSRRSHGGSGLGLTIVCHLVRLMGGFLCIESRPGMGSIFSFAVPAPIAPDPEAVPAGALPAPADLALRILVVDDEAENRNLIRFYLEGTSCDVAACGDGETALRRFETEDYDAVLLDMSMPGMDGYDFAEQARAFESARGRRPTPIIAVSAHAFLDDIRKALAAGCDAYLTKPVTQEALLGHLLRVAGQERPVAQAEPGTHGTTGARTRPTRSPDAGGGLPGPDRIAGRLRALADEALEAVDTGDFGRVKRVGHAVKGLGMRFSLADVARIGQRLESAGGAGDGPAVRNHAEDLGEWTREMAGGAAPGQASFGSLPM